MPEASFRVIISPEARADLYEIIDYWSERAEAWRGEKYFRDLTAAARDALSDPARAGRGRRFQSREHPEAREILVFGVYRIIYEIDEAAQRVNVLRFWHAHRAEPERGA